MKIRKSIVAAVVAVVALLVWMLRPSPVPADYGVVERGALQVTVDEEGRTRVRDRYVVSAPVPGRVQRITLEPGDEVVADRTVLALFEPADPVPLDARTRAELEARVRTAEAGLGSSRADRERLKSELDFAQVELDRYRELYEAGAAPRDRLELAERQVRAFEEALRSADFAVRAAEHQVEVARASLGAPLPQRPGSPARGAQEAIRLQSPVDGIVLRRLQESAAVVPAGHPLLEIGDLERLEVVADLLSTAAVRVRPGQRVLIEQWGGEPALEGRVRLIEPSGFTKISALGVEEQRVNVIVDFEDPREAARHLGDGYRVEVRIVVWERDDVVKVPTSSLFRHEGEWAVFRVENGRAIRRPVQVGQRNGLEAEVLDGLEPGDRIVIYPSDAVRDGVRIAERTA
jgi:HlyD family secretion protein